MNRALWTAAAFACATAIGVAAQTPSATPSSKTDDKTVTVTGCLEDSSAAPGGAVAKSGFILANATMVPMPSLAEGAHAVADGRIDAYASNKAILFEMSDGLPGSRVIGNWGSEAFAFGIPKGRQAALAYLGAFVEQERRRGSFREAAERAGVRGLKK